MLTFAFAFLALAPQTAPLPPYRRETTIQVFPSAYDPAVAISAGTFFAANGSQCVAYAFPSLKKLWSLSVPGGESAEGLICVGATLYVSTEPAYRKKDSHLFALDAKTGKVRWSAPSTSQGSPIAYGLGRLYLSLKPYNISAFDPKTRKPVWTKPVGTEKKNRGMMQGRLETVAFDSGCVLTNCDSTTFCFDAKTGKQLWFEKDSSMFRETLPIGSGVVYVQSGNGAVGRELRTGREVWRTAQSFSDCVGAFQGAFVGIRYGTLSAIAPKSGRELWSHKVGSDRSSGGRQYISPVGSLQFVRGMSASMIVDARGKALWAGKEDEALPNPIWSDGKALVCFDGSRLMRYVHGEEAAIPTDSAARQALARKWVARFDELDESDVKRLESLKDDAFEPLLEAFVKTCDAHDAKGERGDSYALYSKYQDLGKVLAGVVSSRRTNDLMAALGTCKPRSSAKPTLLTLLARVGDPKVVTPYFLKEIEGVETPGFEMYESNTYVARQYIAQSSDPRAVAYMVRVLRDPKADDAQRFEAYVNLARTGGEEGVRAVLAERHKRTLLKPLEERVVEGFLGAGEFGKKMKPLGEKADAQGRTWGLLQSGVLGSAGDLWLAEKVNGKWVRPLFTGVSTEGVSRWAKPAPPEPTFSGKTAKQLSDGAWFTTLVGNAELAKDSDGDGLTDIAEKRLGTDPKKPDTDGDGDSDAVDPWPNAASRELSDTEQAVAAAFEARYHFGASVGPGLFNAPKGMKPFEMVGRSGPMLWVAEGQQPWALPLQQCYEQGVAFIGVYGGTEDDTKPPGDAAVRWNKDRTEASLTISTYFGGLNGTGYSATVRKIGNEWVVVAMRMAYVS